MPGQVRILLAVLGGLTLANVAACKKFPKKKTRPPLTLVQQQKIAEFREQKVPKKPPAEHGELNGLATKVGAKFIPVDNICVEGSEDNCFRRALDRFFVRLDTLADAPRKSVRILQLGDSHIAADYITGTVRQRLQARFGNGGRGFVHVEQKHQYGGRRLGRNGAWKRTRMVDQGQSREPFGFSGMAIESTGGGATVEYALEDDDRVTLFYFAHPQGGKVAASVEGETIGRLDTHASEDRSDYKTFSIPQRSSTDTIDTRKLKITSEGRGVKLFGLSFTENEPGLIYDSVGPVGADAEVWLSLDRKSFREHLRVLDPDLVIVMVGGNDALKIRQGRSSVSRVRRDHQDLVSAIQEALPDADCMLWGPMDAGEKTNGKIVSKTFVKDVRDLQRDVADELGCGFWDMYAAMGGEGAISQWYAENIINADLIHPRKMAGELLGHLFAVTLIDAYDETGQTEQ